MWHSNKAVVIGAGISGLTCAYRLQELGIESLVLEASAIPGGAIATLRRNGFVFEAGPQFPRFPEPVWSLVRALNLQNEFIAGDPKAKRYILRDRQLYPAPFSVPGLLSTGLVSLKSKFLLLTEAFRNSEPPKTEETLEQFVQRKFGPEILNYLVDPFISTIFFGDAAKIGMQSAFPDLVDWERKDGSVARGAIRSFRAKQKLRPPDPLRVTAYANSTQIALTDALPTLGSFRTGMATLPEKLAERLTENIRFSVKVESIAPAQSANGSPRSGWRIQTADQEEIFAEALILSVPAYAAASLLERCSPQLSSLLREIEHAALGVVSLAYHRHQVAHPLDGFGFMIPRQENLHSICTFWNSSVFPQHAPNRMVLVTSYVRASQDLNVSDIADQQLSQIVQTEIAPILRITGAPADTLVSKFRRALPQYAVGHAERVARLREALRQSPGLYLAGNFLSGRSIGDCAASGFRAAEELHRHFQSCASNIPALRGDR